MGQGPRRHRPEAHRYRGQVLTPRKAVGRDLAIVGQRSGNDCGAAALVAVATQHGRMIAYADVCRELAPAGKGTNLLALARAAEHFGFRAAGMTSSYDALRGCPLPAIAHIRRRLGAGHFVVVHRWTATHVVIADPAVGLRRLTRRGLCRRWSGYLLTMVPTNMEVGDVWAQ